MHREKDEEFQSIGLEFTEEELQWRMGKEKPKVRPNQRFLEPEEFEETEETEGYRHTSGRFYEVGRFKSICEDYLNWIENYHYDADVDEKYKVKIFEKAMLALYGNQIFTWITDKMVDDEGRE